VARIRFEFDGISQTVAVSPAPGPRPTLLAIARDNQIPLLFNCEAGACGACIVEIETSAGGTSGAGEMSDVEAFFLRAIGKPGGEGTDGSRLACQYRPGDDEEVRVRFASATCSF
jgi:ferredoxin